MNIENLDWIALQKKMNLRPSEIKHTKEVLSKFPMEITMDSLSNVDDVTDLFDSYELEDSDKVAGYIIEEFLCNHRFIRKFLMDRYGYENFFICVYAPWTSSTGKWELVFLLDESEGPELTIDHANLLKDVVEAELGDEFEVSFELNI